jgi:hypothetical protein
MSHVFLVVRLRPLTPTVYIHAIIGVIGSCAPVLGKECVLLSLSERLTANWPYDDVLAQLEEQEREEGKESGHNDEDGSIIEESKCSVVKERDRGESLKTYFSRPNASARCKVVDLGNSW